MVLEKNTRGDEGLGLFKNRGKSWGADLQCFEN
jgi:hypothetical protein